MQTFIATFIVFGIVIFAMSIGVMLGNGCIHGSCGGLNRLKKLFGGSPCETCSFKSTRDAVSP